MKPNIFISHLSEEKDLALIYKRHITETFADSIDVFVSSDNVSINAGEHWLSAIQKALEKAQIELIICSQASTRQPWVNFEAGGGWFRGVIIVPVCHTDMTPANLPMPLSSLQSINASDKDDLKKLYTLIAKTINVSVPEIDFSSLQKEVKNFEENYKSGLPKVYTKKNVITRSRISALASIIGTLVILWIIGYLGRFKLVNADSLDSLQKKNSSLNSNLQIVHDSLGQAKGSLRQVIVLVDSPDTINVYNKGKPKGETNSDDIYPIISASEKMRDALIITERVYPTWERELQVKRMQPSLIIIHYSAFREDTTAEAERGSIVKFRIVLRTLMDSSGTKFLIYTRKKINVIKDLLENIPDRSVVFTRDELTRRVKYLNVTKPPGRIANNCDIRRQYIDRTCNPGNAKDLKSKADSLLREN